MRGAVGFEEVNGPVDINSSPALPPNFGYPCYSGGAVVPAYYNLSTALCTGFTHSLPLYTYTGGSWNNTDPVSVSAIGVAGGRIFLGDYSQSKIWSINTGGNDVKVHVASAVWPVDIAWAAAVNELVYVDIVTGRVKSISNQPQSGASAAGLTGAVAAAVAVALTALLRM